MQRTVRWWFAASNSPTTHLFHFIPPAMYFSSLCECLRLSMSLPSQPHHWWCLADLQLAVSQTPPAKQRCLHSPLAASLPLCLFQLSIGLIFCLMFSVKDEIQSSVSTKQRDEDSASAGSCWWLSHCALFSLYSSARYSSFSKATCVSNVPHNRTSLLSV